MVDPDLSGRREAGRHTGHPQEGELNDHDESVVRNSGGPSKLERRRVRQRKRKKLGAEETVAEAEASQVAANFMDEEVFMNMGQALAGDDAVVFSAESGRLTRGFISPGLVQGASAEDAGQERLHARHLMQNRPLDVGVDTQELAVDDFVNVTGKSMRQVISIGLVRGTDAENAEQARYAERVGLDNFTPLHVREAMEPLAVEPAWVAARPRPGLSNARACTGHQRMHGAMSQEGVSTGEASALGSSGMPTGGCSRRLSDHDVRSRRMQRPQWFAQAPCVDIGGGPANLHAFAGSLETVDPRIPRNSADLQVPSWPRASAWPAPLSSQIDDRVSVPPRSQLPKHVLGPRERAMDPAAADMRLFAMRPSANNLQFDEEGSSTHFLAQRQTRRPWPQTDIPDVAGPSSVEKYGPRPHLAVPAFMASSSSSPPLAGRGGAGGLFAVLAQSEKYGFCQEEEVESAAPRGNPLPQGEAGGAERLFGVLAQMERAPPAANEHEIRNKQRRALQQESRSVETLAPGAGSSLRDCFRTFDSWDGMEPAVVDVQPHMRSCSQDSEIDERVIGAGPFAPSEKFRTPGPREDAMGVAVPESAADVGFVRVGAGLAQHPSLLATQASHIGPAEFECFHTFDMWEAMEPAAADLQLSGTRQSPQNIYLDGAVGMRLRAEVDKFGAGSREDTATSNAFASRFREDRALPQQPQRLGLPVTCRENSGSDFLKTFDSWHDAEPKPAAELHSPQLGAGLRLQNGGTDMDLQSSLVAQQPFSVSEVLEEHDEEGEQGIVDTAAFTWQKRLARLSVRGSRGRPLGEVRVQI